MDTDDLSRNTYNAIIIEAEKFHHDLTLQFGILSGGIGTEDEYLTVAESMIKNWIKNKRLDDVIDDIFHDNQPNKADFKKCLDKILSNINNVRQIPLKERKFDKW